MGQVEELVGQSKDRVFNTLQHYLWNNAPHFNSVNALLAHYLRRTFSLYIVIIVHCQIWFDRLFSKSYQMHFFQE